MSWVLILSSSDTVGTPPAVVGGYHVRSEAEAAGELATAFENHFDSSGHMVYTRMPLYNQYLVLPLNGHAENGGMTRCVVERDYENACFLVRRMVRFASHWEGGAGPDRFIGTVKHVSGS